MSTQISKDLTIENRNGLHARPSALFVKTASRFRSEIWVEKDEERVNGKSIMGLMMLAAGKGSVLRVTAEGEDATTVLTELEELIRTRFGEE
ncbi:MAG: HPr family phosphocarrier protein [Chthoniobacterales bacterium]|jgi:phosphocarrier protein